MLDSLLKIVNSQSVDLSSAASVVPTHNTVGENTFTTKFTLGRAGLPTGATMTVVRHDAGAIVSKADVTLQYTTDNGTTWFEAGAVSLIPLTGPTRASAPIGLRDLTPEQQASENIQVRVVVLCGNSTAQTVDPTFSVWIGADRAYPQST